MRTRIKSPSPAMVVACLALFVALGGVGYAAATINGKNIKNGTIAGKKLKKGAVTTKQLKNGAIATKKLKNGAVAGAKLRNGTVTTEKIRDGAVTGAKVDAGTLGKVPAAAVADRALAADSAATVKGTHGALALGEQRTVLTHGPLSVLAFCGDADADPADVELVFYIASTEAGSWFSSWEDGSASFGPATPQADRELNDPSWNQASALAPFDYDNPTDAAVVAAAPSGAGFNAYPGGTVEWNVGCKYGIDATVTG